MADILGTAVTGTVDAFASSEKQGRPGAFVDLAGYVIVGGGGGDPYSKVFWARDLAGNPLTGLTPTWLVYKDGDTGANLAPIAFNEIGTTGVYEVIPTATAVGLIDLGVTALNRYVVLSRNDTVFAFAVFDDLTGAPLAGLAPAWESLKVVPGETNYLPQPSITALGGGLYKAVFPTAAHRAGVITLDPGGLASPGPSPEVLYYESVLEGSSASLTSPALLSAVPLTPTTLQLTFDVAMAPLEISRIANYQVRGAVDREVTGVSITSPTVVVLTLEEMLDSAAYTAVVSNVLSTLGDPIVFGVDYNQRAFTGLGAAPTIVLVSPADGAIGVGRDPVIVIDVTDAASGVNLSTVSITLEGETAFTAGAFTTNYSGARSRVSSIANGYRFTVDPLVSYAYAQVIDLVVAATDYAGNVA